MIYHHIIKGFKNPSLLKIPTFHQSNLKNPCEQIHEDEKTNYVNPTKKYEKYSDGWITKST